MNAESLEKDLSSFETDPSLATLVLEDVVYKGEGNANIVIALPHKREVIRFRKSLPGEVSPDGGKTRAQREVRYARNVVSCFLGSYAQIPEIVRYEAADVIKLSDAIRPRRPEKRRNKVITDTYATKFSDYTFLDLRLEIDRSIFRSRSTFCVEIKPKQGYLRKTEQRFPGCPYCLNQYAKLRKGDIAACSNYCPFELFSGVEARMKIALKELLRSPQNNLRIFKDGIVVYDQESSSNGPENVLNEWFRNAIISGERVRRSSVDQFCSLVYAALTRPFAREQLDESSAVCHPCNFLPSPNQTSTFCAKPDAIARAERYLRLARKSCNFDGDELPKNSILERIWNMQRLSYVNTNYVYGIYSDFASLLNDDTIYSDDTMKLRDEIHASAISRALPDKSTNAIVEKTKDVKEIDSETLPKNTIAREYDDNSNLNASSECILSTNVKRIVVNGDFASQTEISANLDSRRLFDGNASLHNRKINNDDEQKANMQIIAKHLSALRNYLLFATARDCSILMTFRELHPENLSKVPVENTIKISEELCFLSSVRGSDLDPKSVHSIKKHRQRDVDIIDSVISLLEDILFQDYT